MRLSVRFRLSGAGGSRWLRVAASGWSGNAVLSATAGVPVVPIVRLADVVRAAGLVAVAGVAVGAVLAVTLRWRGLAWSWAVPTLLAVPAAVLIGWRVAIGSGAAAIAGVATGVYLHGRELLAGGDLATRARQRRGMTDAARARAVRRRIKDCRWVTDDGVAVGQDRTGAAVRIPVCGSRAAMTLVAGATGSGKTVTMTLMALAAIRRGFGVVVIDPKPDDSLLELLRGATNRAGQRLTVWAPDGGAVYNPYQVGTDTEIADKLLSTETFTEPHYQRLAQRYLGHVVRSLRSADMTVSLATVHQHMQPGRLSTLARQLPDQKRSELLDYVETLTPQQERDLAGTRDRLAVLAESDVGDWLDPRTGGQRIDVRCSLEDGDVVLFRLDADRRPLATGMLAPAVIQDLVAISADRQHGDHRPGLVLIDEFSAIAAKEVARLFSRARGAQLSVVLGTQELADLEAVLGAVSSGGIRDRILGNLDVLVSHRQVVPDSAELVAAIAGTRGAWITTHQTGNGIGAIRTGLGSRTRGREYGIHPDEIKGLGVGEAAVIVPRLDIATITRIFHPSRFHSENDGADRA